MPCSPLRLLSRVVCPGILLLALSGPLPTALRAQEARLSNLSTLAQVGTGANIIITGFTVGPGADKKLLIRASGPALTAFGVTGVLADPVLTVLNSANTIVAANDNWLDTDAPAMAAAGAFAFTPGSKDAAVIVTLPPGGYTAQVAGAGGTSGSALIEIYELTSTGTRLTNLSTRAQVGTGGNILIPGLVIAPGSGTRKLLIRAAGPALSALGVPGALADPTMTVFNSAKVAVATNDNWSTPVGLGAADAVLLANAFGTAGAFPFAAGAKDSSILADLAPGSYTIQVSGVAGGTGVGLVEVYDVSPSSPPTVSVVATKSASDESGSNPGEFTFTRSGDTLSALTVNYGVGGSAINGYDYLFLPGTVTFPTGVSSVKVPLLPNPDLQVEGLDTVVLTIAAGTGYAAGAQNSATATIADSPATLYISSLRPDTGATNSTASGTATILLSASGTLASVNVTFSNLSSAEVSAHLRIGPSGDFVFNLPAGQVSGSQWTFAPVGNYSSADLLAALKSGNIYVGIDSANYPTGEVRGTFVQGTGSQAFTAPPAPPAYSLTATTSADAARFLTQATFGPKKAEIDALTGQSIDAWITAQLALPFTSHQAAVLADRNTFGGSGSFTNWNAIHPPNRQAAWFKTVLTAPDQLRQRVAFALSQILVVSDISLGGDNQAEPLAHYYDVLGNGAFGNFRTLLENVTLHPMMGNYLSSLRNAKADPVAGTTPDENYAREVMQLFTIGLSLLQPDGTLSLNADGLPIPTYNQTTITEMAKVFTGWSYAGTTNFRTGGGFGASLLNPMILFPSFHDDTAKSIVNSVVVPAGQGGAKDLQLALDALFNHPNTGPFISKLLIQRLVTSNPSPAYVYRVAQKFANNGSGVRGDLAAVVRAILTDYEARSATVAANTTYGKLKEPLLRLTGLLRTFGATSTSGRYLGYRVTVNGTVIDGTTPKPAAATDIITISTPTRLDNVQSSLVEAAMRSNTVFNFYHPDYVLPGPLATAGLVAPEFEITDDNFAISVPNALRTFVNAALPNTTADPYTLTLNLAYEQTLVATPAALVDHLNTLLCSGSLSAAARARIVTALAALPAATTTVDRAKSAVLLVLTSPAAAIQK